LRDGARKEERKAGEERRRLGERGEEVWVERRREYSERRGEDHRTWGDFYGPAAIGPLGVLYASCFQSIFAIQAQTNIDIGPHAHNSPNRRYIHISDVAPLQTSQGNTYATIGGHRGARGGRCKGAREGWVCFGRVY
jgi:hypothetical protein